MYHKVNNSCLGGASDTFKNGFNNTIQLLIKWKSRLQGQRKKGIRTKSFVRGKNTFYIEAEVETNPEEITAASNAKQASAKNSASALGHQWSHQGRLLAHLQSDSDRINRSPHPTLLEDNSGGTIQLYITVIM